MDMIGWLVAFVILIGIEAATMALTTIWFAGGALAAFIAALLGANVAVQVVLFLAVSIILLIFTRPVVMRMLNKHKTATNAESLIGEQAIVTQTINNLMGRGEVFINGLEWMARSQQDNDTIEKDTVVRILRIDGVKLIVERKER